MASMTDDSLLSFPCDLPIKIFGRNQQDFRSTVLAIAQSHFPELSNEDVTEQRSREDTFLSLTINVRAKSRNQVDAAYRELTSVSCVLIVL
jgi:putative lipoic acid-binding regulatory protein